ncbi:hypothetical protein GCM10017779_68650 [Streptomyces capillispiralis]|uniref:Uncharacterized protein n=2 Tax=Streptomyces capillispiralis TaxID=68182 RepID=A0A561SGU3_9ACTN|nr:hypothetical protein FHX78_12116 [Streptomyces capillispiralis]GHH96408.1 hypothetical protein GCM10017779_68650 [Streptomyces capillispiralis]
MPNAAERGADPEAARPEPGPPDGRSTVHTPYAVTTTALAAIAAVTWTVSSYTTDPTAKAANATVATAASLGATVFGIKAFTPAATAATRRAQEIVQGLPFHQREQAAAPGAAAAPAR